MLLAENDNGMAIDTIKWLSLNIDIEDRTEASFVLGDK